MSKAKSQLASKDGGGGFVWVFKSLLHCYLGQNTYAGIFRHGGSGSTGRKQRQPRARGSLQKARTKVT